jgi:hypothetical protein
MEMNELKEKCPNCIKPDPEIEKMPNGSCGVCAGKGFIVWQDTGIKVNLSPLTPESK